MTEMPKFYEIPKAHSIPDGAIGIWQIPDLSILVPVYAPGKGRTEQQIIDAENSASWVRWGCAYEIGDHCLSLNGKGRWCINKVEPLMPAFFIRREGTYKYECYRTCVADVKAYGYRIGSVPVQPYSSKDILNACCVGSDSSRNFLAVFRYVGKMPANM